MSGGFGFFDFLANVKVMRERQPIMYPLSKDAGLSRIASTALFCLFFDLRNAWNSLLLHAPTLAE